MIVPVLVIILIMGGAVSAPAQAIYAENQIPAQGVRIEYRLTIENPNLHIYTVEMDIRGIHGDTVSVAMPAWAPGAYRIRNYARNVQDFQARTFRA